MDSLKDYYRFAMSLCVGLQSEARLSKGMIPEPTAEKYVEALDDAGLLADRRQIARLQDAVTRMLDALKGHDDEYDLFDFGLFEKDLK